MFSKVKPDLKVTDLRVETYQQMYTRFHVASNRAAKTNCMKHQSLLNDIKSMPAPLEDEPVMKLAKVMGFNENWLKPLTKRTRRKCAPAAEAPAAAPRAPPASSRSSDQDAAPASGFEGFLRGYKSRRTVRLPPRGFVPEPTSESTVLPLADAVRDPPQAPSPIESEPHHASTDEAHASTGEPTSTEEETKNSAFSAWVT